MLKDVELEEIMEEDSPGEKTPGQPPSQTVSDMFRGMLTTAIRCTLPTCRCDCFAPGKAHMRTCDNCQHGWVAHALDKLTPRHSFHLGTQVEIVQPNIVFDIASLMLYGAHATPIRLKILLDRLFSVLQHDEVIQVLHGFGWSYEDYARGYILQEKGGNVLDKWSITTKDEEAIILQQFLRFGETKAIAQEIILQESRERQDLYSRPTSRAESDIKKFIERSNLSMQSLARSTFDPARYILNSPGKPPSFSSPREGGRIVSPTSLQHYSPNASSRESSRDRMTLPVQTPSPVNGSPLGRLQTMQPFDYRTNPDRSSPAISPTSSSDKISQVTPSTPTKSPLNLNISSPISVPPPPPPLAPIPSKPALAERAMELITTPSSYSPHDFSISPAVLHGDTETEAINYSTHGHQASSSPYADRKLRALRKTAVSAPKRSFSPSIAYGGTLISSQGKKRVICTACNKTFCDKGALKIHYSAVHLKEMHKCSVDGCNMMFSSRRSRNRHSANPNPKLHMPQTKRKIDQDEKSDSSSATGSVTSETPKFDNPMMSSLVYPSPSSQGNQSDAKSKGLSEGHGDLMMGDQAFYVDSNNQLTLMPTKRIKLEQDDKPTNEPTEPIKEATNEKPVDLPPVSSGSSRRKRKSAAPIRVAQTDDRELFVMSEDEGEDLSLKPRTNFTPSHSPTDSKLSGSNSPHGNNSLQTTKSPHGNDRHISNNSPNSNDGLHGNQFKAIEETAIEHMNMALEQLDSEIKHTGANPEQAATSDTEMHSDLDEDSSASDDSGKLNGNSSDTDIPLDQDNPCKCTACGKLFQNHFGVKVHYQNVHLKLMHMCNIEGCNAAFPSRRSRNRHSNNLNLHRKLLSTTLPQDTPDSNHENQSPQSLREEFLSKIYRGDDTSSSRNGNGYGDDEGPIDMSKEPNCDSENNEIKHHEHIDSENQSESEESKGENEGTVKCHLCSQNFRDNLALKEHYENIHPKEMFACNIGGCEKKFSTRKSRNRHSQNENLHRHLLGHGTNGIA